VITIAKEVWPSQVFVSTKDRDKSINDERGKTPRKPMRCLQQHLPTFRLITNPFNALSFVSRGSQE